MDFILASGSPRRRQLLKKAGYRFKIVPSSYHERIPKQLTKPSTIVMHLALEKARVVARSHPTEWVLGADTIVYLNGKLVGKPRNKKHAVLMLSTLSGRWQKVYTGVALVRHSPRRTMCGYGVSQVKMRQIPKDEITNLAAKHLDKAGAYAIQEKNDAFVDTLKGDYDNVVGLPLRVVKRLLRLAL